jgi:hypothetical protein
LIRFQSTPGQSLDVLKGFIGVIEVFFGAAYAVVVNTTFGGAATDH